MNSALESLATNRLKLRAFAPSDGPCMRALCGARAVARTIGAPHPFPEGLAEHWISKHDELRAADKEYAFAVTLDKRLVGSVELRRADAGDLYLGFWIGEAWWGRGYATEAATAVRKFAYRRLEAPRLLARHVDGNAASGRVLEKLGFVAHGKEHWPADADKPERLMLTYIHRRACS